MQPERMLFLYSLFSHRISILTGVSSFADSSVMILIVMFMERTSRFPATRALNRELKIIFDRRGVEIPFNQIVVHEAKNANE